MAQRSLAQWAHGNAEEKAAIPVHLLSAISPPVPAVCGSSPFPASQRRPRQRRAARAEGWCDPASAELYDDAASLPHSTASVRAGFPFCQPKGRMRPARAAFGFSPRAAARVFYRDGCAASASFFPQSHANNPPGVPSGHSGGLPGPGGGYPAVPSGSHAPPKTLYASAQSFQRIALSSSVGCFYRRPRSAGVGG